MNTVILYSLIIDQQPHRTVYTSISGLVVAFPSIKKEKTAIYKAMRKAPAIHPCVGLDGRVYQIQTVFMAKILRRKPVKR